MTPLFANTLWSAVYFFELAWHEWLDYVGIGLTAETLTFLLYTRTRVRTITAIWRLLAANLMSFVGGYIIFAFMPFGIDKRSPGQIVFVFIFCYLVTVAIEARCLRSLFPAHRALLLRSVFIANFISYAVLFSSFIFAYGGWRAIHQDWSPYIPQWLL